MKHYMHWSFLAISLRGRLTLLRVIGYVCSALSVTVCIACLPSFVGVAKQGKSASRYAVEGFEFLPFEGKPAIAVDFPNLSRLFVSHYVYESGDLFDVIRSKDVYAFFPDSLYQGISRTVPASVVLRSMDLPLGVRPRPKENIILFVRQGWPLRCTQCVVYASGGRVHSSVFLGSLPGEPFAAARCWGGLVLGGFPVVVIPLTPMPFQFSVNVLVFICMIAMVDTAKFCLMFSMRLRRNCCVRCGYPSNVIGGTSSMIARCPECGCNYPVQTGH
jgi:hypothetical protein